VVVLATVVLLASGIALIVVGPGGGLMLTLHQASFFVWLAALGAHVLGHLGSLVAVRADLSSTDRFGESRWRLLLVAGAVVVGAVAAVIVLPHGAPWMHWVRVEH
jgi:hypothetical protein